MTQRKSRGTKSKQQNNCVEKSHNVTLMIAFMFIDDNYLGFGLVRETLSVSVCLPTESDKMQISSSCLTCV